MGRYFLEKDGDESASKSEVFTITAEDTKNVINRQRKFKKKQNKNRDQDGSADRDSAFAKKRKKGKDKFPGKAPVAPELLEKYNRSDGVKANRLKSKFARKMAQKREFDRQRANEIAARTEILQGDEAGYMEGDSDDEFTARVSQTKIKKAVDTESAAKGFDLNLAQFGPYSLDYTRNGRFLLLGGRKGHVAALDWKEKQLTCEINVQDSVHDVKWLHSETMFAIAQRKWTYIYDNQGIELHCLKQLDNVLKMEFLPYHFLLATAVRNLPNS